MNTKVLSTLIFIALTAIAHAQTQTELKILLKTNKGNMTILLYDNTPLHRENFIKLVNQKFYDGILFHRVINEFMIQTGDPNSKGAEPGKQLGSGGPGYTIPAEFNPKNIHKKGALAAARQDDKINPSKSSSGSQFYIVQGKKHSFAALEQIENSINNKEKLSRVREYIKLPENKNIQEQITALQQKRDKAGLDSLGAVLEKKIAEKYKDMPDFQYTEEQKKIYSTIGGTPFLDMGYTVFGEIIDGINVIDSIASVKTLKGDRPETDIVIQSMELIKQ